MAKGGTEKTKQTVKGETPKPWQNRIVGTGTEAPDQLLANPRNWRIHPQAQQEGLEAVLDRVGWVQNVVVNRRTGFMVDGHLRVTLAMRREEPEVPVVYVDLSPEEEDLILATFDPISSLAGTDRDHIAALLRGIDSHGDTALDALLEKIAEDAGLVDGLKDGEGGSGLLDGADPDAVPEPPKVPVTKPGDLYTLGRHRLLCGDSTNRLHVDRLMDGAKADMVFTDPPYGMDLNTDYAMTNRVHGNTYRPVLGDDQDFDPSPILEWFDYCNEIFLWGADYYCQHIPKGGAWEVWDKKKDGLDESIGTGFELCWSKQPHKRMVARFLWSGFTAKERGEARAHPTQKPVALCEWFLNRWGEAGGIVVDLFGGSGSTLIACEATGRACRMMELDPIYCDVIVKRWEDATGQKAELTRE